MREGAEAVQAGASGCERFARFDVVSFTSGETHGGRSTSRRAESDPGFRPEQRRSAWGMRHRTAKKSRRSYGHGRVP